MSGEISLSSKRKKKYLEKNERFRLPKSTKYRYKKDFPSSEDASTDDEKTYDRLASTQAKTTHGETYAMDIGIDNEQAKNIPDDMTVEYDKNEGKQENGEESDSRRPIYFSADDSSDSEDEQDRIRRLIGERLHEDDLNYNLQEESFSEEDSLEEEDMTSLEDLEMFAGLKNMLSEKKYTDITDAHFSVSVTEMLLAILKYSKRHSISNTALQDVFKMINSFADRRILPDTRYLINKVFSSTNKIDYYAVCPDCKLFLRKFDRTECSVRCDLCEKAVPVKGNNANFFVILDIKEDIKMLLEKYDYQYDFFVSTRKTIPGIKSDICDGDKYLEFVNSLPDEEKKSYASFIFNSDGSPLFKSSGSSIWPIQLILNELPVDIRNKNPVTCALWCGKNKPDMNVFMSPFVDKVNLLTEEGILCKINNGYRNIKIYGLCCCVDSVARAPMQGINQFNGFSGCSWCLHPGIPVSNVKGNKKTIKYVLLNYNPGLRNEKETINDMQESLKAQKPINGIKCSTALLKLYIFNIICGFVPDKMHNIDLGICKQFATYWFDVKGQRYSLSKKTREKIDKLLLSIKVPNHVARLSRPLKDRKYWKAREWENWLLYYSLPVMKEIPRFSKYREHWELLVTAAHLLMKTSVTDADIARAHDLLVSFVVQTEKLYSARAMSYNIHQLLHLAQSVRNWGPLFAHSGYSFEAGNGALLNMVKAAKGVLHQICRSIDLQKSIYILQKHVIKENNSSPVLKFLKYLEADETSKSIKLPDGSCRYFGKAVPANKEWITKLNLSPNNTYTFHRMSKDSCLFSSNKRKNLRTDNTFAKLKNGVIIQIFEFIVDCTNNVEYTICKMITTNDVTFANCEYVKEVEMLSDVTFVETNSIESIVVNIAFNDNQYVIPVPNLYNY